MHRETLDDTRRSPFAEKYMSIVLAISPSAEKHIRIVLALERRDVPNTGKWLLRPGFRVSVQQKHLEILVALLRQTNTCGLWWRWSFSWRPPPEHDSHLSST